MELKIDEQRIWTFSNGDRLPYRLRVYEAAGKPSIVLVSSTEQNETGQKSCIAELAEEGAFRLALFHAVTNLEDGLLYIEQIQLGQTALYFYNPLMGIYRFVDVDGSISDVLEEEGTIGPVAYLNTRCEQLLPSEVAALIAPLPLSEWEAHEEDWDSIPF